MIDHQQPLVLGTLAYKGFCIIIVIPVLVTDYCITLHTVVNQPDILVRSRDQASRVSIRTLQRRN